MYIAYMQYALKHYPFLIILLRYFYDQLLKEKDDLRDTLYKREKFLR